MKRSWLVVLLLLSVGVNIGVLAMIGLSWARAPRPIERLLDRPPPLEHLVEQLGLEGAQRERFVAEQRRFFDAFGDLRRELGDTRLELRREVGGASPDRGRIEELVDASARLTAELDRLFVDHVLATREILDGEQERRYLSLLDRLRRDDERPRHRPPPPRR